MSEALLIASFTLVAGAIAGAYRIIYKHINHCQTDVAEKITKLSTEVTSLKDEVVRLRDMRHDMMDHVSKVIAENQAWLVDKILKK